MSGIFHLKQIQFFNGCNCERRHSFCFKKAQSTGLFLGARSLKKVYHDGVDLSAREDMSLCSLFGGMALANSKLVRIVNL